MPVDGQLDEGEDRLALRPRTIPELLDRAAMLYPGHVALDFLGREWTYGDLDAEVGRAAYGLEQLGLKAGDRFGLCLPNTPYYVVLYFAALRLGAIVVNLNPLYTEDELDHLLVRQPLLLPPQTVIVIGEPCGVSPLTVCDFTVRPLQLGSTLVVMLRPSDCSRLCASCRVWPMRSGTVTRPFETMRSIVAPLGTLIPVVDAPW